MLPRVANSPKTFFVSCLYILCLKLEQVCWLPSDLSHQNKSLSLHSTGNQGINSYCKGKSYSLYFLLGQSCLVQLWTPASHIDWFCLSALKSSEGEKIPSMKSQFVSGFHISVNSFYWCYENTPNSMAWFCYKIDSNFLSQVQHDIQITLDNCH